MSALVACVLAVYLARVLGEIARLLAVGSLVGTGIGLVERVALDGGAHLARQTGTVLEHVFRLDDVVLLGHVALEEYLLQVVAVLEHFGAIGHCRCEYTPQVERREFLATIEHILHGRHFLGVELREVDRLQLRAVRKHSIHGGRVFGRELVAEHDIPQYKAVVEHRAHRGHIGGVEVRQIQCLKPDAIFKHAVYILSSAHVQMAQIDRFQLGAIGEHRPHVYPLGGVEVLHADNLLHAREVVEEEFKVHARSVLHRWLDLDDLEPVAPCIICVRSPFREGYLPVAYRGGIIEIPTDMECVAVVARLAIDADGGRFVVIADGKTGDTDLSVFTIALDTEDHGLSVARKNGDTALDLLATIGEDGVVGGGEVENDAAEEIAALGLNGDCRFRLLIQAPCLASVDLAVVAVGVDGDGELVVVDGLYLLAVGVVFVHVLIVDAFGHGVSSTKRGTHHCCCHQGCKQSK